MPSHDTGYRCVVLVHGFREELPQHLNPKYLFRRRRHFKELEKWANRLSKSIEASQGNDLIVWPFRTTRFLNGRLKQLASDLDVKIHKRIDSRLHDDPPAHVAHKDIETPNIVFVTHGVGAWVVRELFASNLSKSYRPYVCGVVFVDAMPIREEDSTATKSDNRYEAYLREFTEKLGFNIDRKDDHARTGLRQLISQMISVDEESLKALEGLPVLREEGPTRIRYRALLLDKSPESKASSSLGKETQRRFSCIEEDVFRMFQGTTSQERLVTGSDAVPFPSGPPTPVIQEEHRASSPDWAPEGSAISGLDRAESPDLGSFSSVGSAEREMNALELTDFATSVQHESGILSHPETIKPDRAISARDIELLAMSFAQKGKLRRAEDLLKQCLPPEGSQDTVTANTLRVRLKISVIRLLQGHFKAAEKGFNDIERLITVHISPGILFVGFDKRPFLALKTSMVIWRSVLMIAKGLYNQATLDLEELKAKGSETNELLLSDNYLRAQLHVTLGRCYAYTGNLRGANFELNRARDIYFADQKPVQEHSTHAILLLDHKMNYHAARARVQISSGNYDEALSGCQAALEVARTDYGVKHFQALELASIECQILSIASSPSGAEEACNHTLKLIVEELGPEHPRALETTGHLVDALLARSRFVEATDTVKSLSRQCETILGSRHPLSLRSRHQLCRSYLAIGRYATAEDELNKVFESFARTDDVHLHLKTALKLCSDLSGTYSIQMDLPATLKFYSDLAGVLNKLGRSQVARECAEAVMLQHAKMYSVSASVVEGMGHELGSKWWTSAVSATAIPGGNVYPMSSYNFYRFFRSVQNTTPLIRMDPDALSTLELLVKVEEHEQARFRCEEVMNFIHDQRLKLFGMRSVPTLEGQYRLALFYHGLNKFEEAYKHLRVVWQRRKEVLSPTNSQTLSAERELMITSTVQGGTLLHSELSSVDIESSVVNIATMHEWQLGKFHPETLKSLIWMFTVQIGLLSKPVEARHTLSMIQERLQDKSVQRERLIECLNVEASLVWFCENQEMSADASRMRQHVGAVARDCVLPGDDREDGSQDKIVDKSMAETLRSIRSKFPDRDEADFEGGRHTDTSHLTY